MLRTFLCSAVVLALCTCSLPADEAKKDKDTNKAGEKYAPIVAEALGRARILRKSLP